MQKTAGFLHKKSESFRNFGPLKRCYNLLK